MEQHAEQSERRFVRRAVLWSCVAALCIAAIILILRSYAPQLTLLRASTQITSGHPDEALALLDQLDPSVVGVDSVQSLQYQAALELSRQGREDEALALFDKLSSFANAKERSQEIQYDQAIRLEQQGSLEEAAQAFYLLGNYEDAATRYEQCMAILHPTATPTLAPTPSPTPTATPTATPSPTPSAAPIVTLLPVAIAHTTPSVTPSVTPSATPSPTPAPTTVIEGLRVRREANPIGRVALGRDFTVGVCEDERVLAVGHNDVGQCDVTAWSNVVQVAAGARHTVGLLANGTVVSTGDNTYGQCDVAGWTSIRQIVANDYDTFGLTDAGTVLHCGYHDYDTLSAWHDVRKLSTGSYGVCAIYDGGVLASHPSMLLKGIVSDADVSRGYAIGLREDGTVLQEGIELPAWEHIVALSAGENAILALDADNCIHAYFFRSSDALSPTSLPTDSDAIGVVAGATHYAILFTDGSVCCFGDNAFGQCNTEDWSLAH